MVTLEAYIQELAHKKDPLNALTRKENFRAGIRLVRLLLTSSGINWFRNQ